MEVVENRIQPVEQNGEVQDNSLIKSQDSCIFRVNESRYLIARVSPVAYA
jgi:hypothetical protein